jgi:hypothetical protein
MVVILVARKVSLVSEPADDMHMTPMALRNGNFGARC